MEADWCYLQKQEANVMLQKNCSGKTCLLQRSCAVIKTKSHTEYLIHCISHCLVLFIVNFVNKIKRNKFGELVSDTRSKLTGVEPDVFFSSCLPCCAF